MKKFGYTKGALSLAAEKALLEWSDNELADEEVRRLIKDAGIGSVVSEIEGILKHVKGKTSVELQHEASKIRAKRALGAR
jgi:histone H3/H4